MKNYSVKEKVKTVLSYIAYALFLIFIVYTAIYAENTMTKWGFLILSFAALLIVVYSEYLKQLYHQALFEMNFELDAEKSMKTFDKLLNKDILKGYNNSKHLYYVQAYTELGESEKVLQILFDNEKEFRSGPNMLMIFYYYQIRSYLLLQDYEQAQEAFQKTSALRKMKKPVKIFSWDEIDGLGALAYNNVPKAYKAFANVNMKNMNLKEKVFITKNLIKCSKNDNDRFKHQKILDELKVKAKENS
ncbi:MAG: hypothetical protein R3Y57_06960 [Erysipelotrichaceae bacterium]